MNGALAVSASWVGDVVVPVVVAGFAAGFAVWWPYRQSRRRASQFHAMIARELRSVRGRTSRANGGGKRLQRRFVHEELIARGRVSDNRDFLLTLDPDVVTTCSSFGSRSTKETASSGATTCASSPG